MERDLRGGIAWLMHLLNGLAVAAGVAYLFLLWVQLEGHLLQHQVGIGLAGAAVLFALNLLRLLYLRRPGVEAEDYLLAQGGGGVRVAVEAIRSELKVAAEAIPEVTRCRVSVVRQGPRRVRIQASFVACEGANILVVSERIRAALKARFQEMIPLGEGVKQEIEIDFESFGGKAPRKAAEEKPSAPEPPPFTGPRYPVDGEM